MFVYLLACSPTCSVEDAVTQCCDLANATWDRAVLSRDHQVRLRAPMEMEARVEDGSVRLLRTLTWRRDGHATTMDFVVDQAVALEATHEMSLDGSVKVAVPPEEWLEAINTGLEATNPADIYEVTTADVDGVSREVLCVLYSEEQARYPLVMCYIPAGDLFVVTSTYMPTLESVPGGTCLEVHDDLVESMVVGSYTLSNPDDTSPSDESTF